MLRSIGHGLIVLAEWAFVTGIMGVWTVMFITLVLSLFLCPSFVGWFVKTLFRERNHSFTRPRR